MMGESLRPFHIHLEKSPSKGDFRIVFENCQFLELFCAEHWPHGKIATKSKKNPIKVSFMLDPMESEEEEHFIIEKFKSWLRKIDIELYVNISTGVFSCDFPNFEFIFILLLAIFQSLEGV